MAVRLADDAGADFRILLERLTGAERLARAIFASTMLPPTTLLKETFEAVIAAARVEDVTADAKPTTGLFQGLANAAAVLGSESMAESVLRLTLEVEPALLDEHIETFALPLLACAAG